MARAGEPRRRAPARGRPEPAPKRGLDWPLWAAAVLAVLYLLTHADMIQPSLSMWAGLLSALILGQ